LLDFPSGSAEQLDFMRNLRSAAHPPKIVVLTSEINGEWLRLALAAGADGYLMKDMSPDALIQSLHLIVLGEKVLPSDLAKMLVNGSINLDDPLRATAPMHGLSDREVQILRCLVRGSSNKLIANQLNITEGTVKVHLKGVLKKINARNRTQAAIWALNYGLDTQAPAANDGLCYVSSLRPAVDPMRRGETVQ
jgi:two-component system nitrate/nitrite response regulator NarL